MHKTVSNFEFHSNSPSASDQNLSRRGRNLVEVRCIVVLVHFDSISPSGDTASPKLLQQCLPLAFLLFFSSRAYLHSKSAQNSPPLPPPNFIVPGSDPTGVWGRIQERLWNDVFTKDTHFVCPNGFDGPCGCTPERFADGNTDPAEICIAYENVRCGFLGRKAWRAVFHDAGTYNKNDGTGGANGSLRYELNSEKNAGTELGRIVSIYEQILEDEVDAFGTMENGDPRGMADLIAFGGVLALYGCGHPGLMFSPGREDASVSDADILPAANESPEVMFGKFERMGFTRPEIVTLMAAGHTVANGLEGAAFDLTPAVFDLGWFGQTLAAVDGVDNFPQFQPAPFIVNTDAHLVNDDETKAIMVQRATAANGKATFLENFEDVFHKMVYLGQSRCAAYKSLREEIGI